MPALTQAELDRRSEQAGLRPRVRLALARRLLPALQDAWEREPSPALWVAWVDDAWRATGSAMLAHAIEQRPESLTPLAEYLTRARFAALAQLLEAIENHRPLRPAVWSYASAWWLALQQLRRNGLEPGAGWRWPELDQVLRGRVPPEPPARGIRLRIGQPEGHLAIPGGRLALPAGWPPWIPRPAVWGGSVQAEAARRLDVARARLASLREETPPARTPREGDELERALLAYRDALRQPLRQLPLPGHEPAPWPALLPTALLDSVSSALELDALADMTPMPEPFAGESRAGAAAAGLAAVGLLLLALLVPSG